MSLNRIIPLLIALTVLFPILPGVVEAQNSPPSLDASSKENFQESREAIKQSLPANQQKKFDQALMIIMSQLLNEKYDAFLKAINGKTGIEVIAEATKVVQRMEQKVKDQNAKKTTYQLPDWIFGESVRVGGQSSLACKAILSASILKSNMFPPDEENFKNSEESFLLNAEDYDSIIKTRKSQVEAFSKEGTDKLALKIKDKTMSLQTGASVEAGMAEPSEFVILQNNNNTLLAIWFHNNEASNDAFSRLDVHTFLLNKKSGLGIWTKSNSRPNIFIDERPIPEVQSYFLRCS